MPLCRNSSDRSDRERLGLEKLSFHSFPDQKTQLAKEWIANIHRDVGPSFRNTKRTKICSVHFNPDDFYHGQFDIHTTRRRLKPTAVPSIFPWTIKNPCRTSVTSNIASSQQQRYDLKVPVSEFDVNNFDDKFHNVTDNPDNVDGDGNSAVDFESLEEAKDTTSQVVELQEKVKELTEQLCTVENTVASVHFRYENIKRKDDLVKFYTGFPDHITLLTFYEEILESGAKVMRQWEGNRCKDSYNDVKIGCAYKLPLLEQFFMTMVRLRLGVLELDLALRFDISQSSVSRITVTWINLLYHSL